MTMTDRQKTFAELFKEEDELLRRRFVHHTRPKGSLTMEQARELCERMDGGLGETARKEEV